MTDRLLTFFNAWRAELDLHHGDARVMYAIDRQVSRMRKRALLGDATLAGKACAAFVQTNDRVAQTELALLPQEINDAALFVRNALERATQLFDEEDVQGVLCHEAIFSNWRFGPGASNGIRGTHTAEKIGQPMTCTARAVPLVVKLRGTNPYMSLFDKANVGPVPVVSGSKLATVPKNEDTMRTIAIEPSGNMALQLSVGRYLEIALKCIGLDISTQQPKNKALAMAAFEKGFATLDLKSASDMIHPDLVRALLPLEWFSLLWDLRSPDTTLPDGTKIELHMMSTMGNGFTFPLMTLIIASLVYAVSGGKNRRCYLDWKSHAVFGDDIIVPKAAYAKTVDILTRAGFVVNLDKSYGEGPFYESCGGDYFMGYDVTPVYVKSLRSDPEIYTAINQVLEWSARHEICCVRTIRYLVSLLRKAKAFLVPEWCNPDSGLLTAMAPRRYKYLSPAARRVIFDGDSIFATCLAVGGYLEADGARLFYTPRSNRVKYVTRSGRIPEGYAHGWDPRKRSPRSSDWISLMVNLV